MEFRSTPISTKNVIYFAASVGRSMTISIDNASMQEAEFHDCERALEATRKALGLLERNCGIVKCVRI